MLLLDGAVAIVLVALPHESPAKALNKPAQSITISERKGSAKPSRSIVRSSAWVESVRRCIIQRESRGNYRAQNRYSSASGAYQFLDSTWRSVTGLEGSAKDYSKERQDAAFYKLFDNGRGRSHWSYPPKQCW